MTERMSPARERSVGPAATVPPRMLRIEYKGQPYDWFNLDEMGDIVRTSDFSNTLRENITHYFGVPYEFQAVYDEEGLLSSMIDFSRALRSVRPWLRVYDAREMTPELKEKTTKQLEEIHAEVMRSQRSLSSWGIALANGGMGHSHGATDASAGNAALPQQLFSPSGQNGLSPKRDPSVSLADAVKSASESGAHSAPSQFAAPKPAASTAFPWSTTALEAYSMPRYPTPPPHSLHHSIPMGSQIPGVMPSQARSGFQDLSVFSRSAPTSMMPPANMMPPVNMMLPLSQGLRPPMPLYASMSQPQALPPYSGGMPLAAGMRPHSQSPRATGSSTPVMPLGSRGELPSANMAPADMWRQHSGPGGAVGGPLIQPGATAAGPGAAAGGYSSKPPTPRDVSEQATGILDVILTKEPGFERFGFANVPTKDNRALVVSWVDANGLLQMKWNRMVDASQQVMEGDKIVSVNGRRDDVEAMRDQLQMPSVQLQVDKTRLSH